MQHWRSIEKTIIVQIALPRHAHEGGIDKGGGQKTRVDSSSVEALVTPDAQPAAGLLLLLSLLPTQGVGCVCEVHEALDLGGQQGRGVACLTLLLLLLHTLQPVVEAGGSQVGWACAAAAA